MRAGRNAELKVVDMKHEQLANPGAATDPTHDDGRDSPDNAAACPACGAAALVASPITTVFRTGESLAVIRGIPAMVCTACHEEYIDDRTAMRLDLMRGGDFAAETPAETMTVPVYAFRSGGGGAS